jgi:four helix bundle protein
VGYGVKYMANRLRQEDQKLANINSSMTYRDLEVYKIAHRLAVDIHHLSLRLPKYELYETGNQLRRSSKSVSANIVEGFGRRKYKADFIRFLIFAHASCNETIEWVEYVRDCHPDFKEAIREIMDKLDELGRKLNSFIRAVERSHKS